jgi:hypothetical protein
VPAQRADWPATRPPSRAVRERREVGGVRGGSGGMPPGYEAAPSRPGGRLEWARVSWRESLNDVLVGLTGHRIQRVPHRAKPGRRTAARRRAPAAVAPGDRLVEAPVFILCSIRSGSTLLRVLLDSHPEIHAPHELHLRHLLVRARGPYAKAALHELGLEQQGLRYLMWDRLLHRELTASGKRLIVDKTPNNVFIADQLLACWPDARFVFLLRHPAAIARSRQKLRPRDSRNVERVLRYCAAVERARQAYDGYEVRYEELTADPERVLRRLCGFLGVAWDPRMLEYGAQDHGPYRAGLGDWAGKIGAGRVQAAEPPPAEIPAPLREVAAAWGYAPRPASAPAATP